MDAVSTSTVVIVVATESETLERVSTRDDRLSICAKPAA
jgi:hypothetical protein